MNLSIRPHFLGLLLLGLVVFGIERLIVTDEEAIEQVAQSMSDAIAEQRFEDLEPLLHAEFEFQGKDRAETIAYVRSLVRKYKPIGAQVALVDIQVEDDTGVAVGPGSSSASSVPRAPASRVCYSCSRGCVRQPVGRCASGVRRCPRDRMRPRRSAGTRSGSCSRSPSSCPT